MRRWLKAAILAVTLIGGAEAFLTPTRAEASVLIMNAYTTTAQATTAYDVSQADTIRYHLWGNTAGTSIIVYIQYRAGPLAPWFTAATHTVTSNVVSFYQNVPRTSEFRFLLGTASAGSVSGYLEAWCSANCGIEIF